ncbi:MAG: dephospho-CoA kinase [Blastocatellales bacterium]
MLKAGLTGGIATGKSFILSVLRELGCEVTDADRVAHEVMEPGRPAFDEIVAHFGPGVIGADGRLDRARIGEIVFADPAERERLNSIVHPRVYEAQSAWFAEIEKRNPDAIAVVDAALMIETGSFRRFDKLIVAWCRPELQLQRLMERNSLTEEQARARIGAQMPSSEKLKYADYAIDTSNGFEDTRRQVEAVHAELRKQSTR